MVKTSLPVLLLKNIILLPHNDIRYDVVDDTNKLAIEVAQKYSNGHILIVSDMNYLEEKLQLSKLPRIGVIARIKSVLDIGGGKKRVILTGINRAKVLSYTNIDREIDFLEAKIGPFERKTILASEQELLIKKVISSLNKYMDSNPLMSNSIVAQITESGKISEVSDIVASNLPFNQVRLHKYLINTDPSKRMLMILEDLAKEAEIMALEKDIDMKLKFHLDKSQKDFILREKIKTIKEELGEVSTKDNDIIKIRDQINTKEFPDEIRERLEFELSRYEMASPQSPETGIIRNYIDWILALPWNNFSEDNKDLKEVRAKLDETHFGLIEAKERIIEYLAVKNFSNNLRSPIICLVGPPGVGKTSLAKSISNSISREFLKITVGGVKDEAEIMGHRRTYLGANPGRIIQALKKASTSNPLFLIDEIDKMSSDFKGDPANSLLEILDFEQNSHFSDNYIEEEFDLSNIMFVATANYINDIPEALYDRLEIIHISGYTMYEKIDIAKKHLIKKQLTEHGLKAGDITFSEKILIEMINFYTKEAGVREFERQIAKMIRKIITKNNVDGKDFSKTRITFKMLKIMLGKRKYIDNNSDKIDEIGKVNGLAYTSYGGAVLPIEVTFYKGRGELRLTGSLGEVMKESAQIALSYIKANAKTFKINIDEVDKSDIHIHLPEGAIRKDGPSAGIALTTALISTLTKTKARSDVAMTGEITLRGKVLPIGGLKEKSMGAFRANINQIIYPKQNANDLNEIPNEIKDKIEYIPVSNYLEVFDIMFIKKP